MTNQKACLCFALPALIAGALLGYLAHPDAPEPEPGSAAPAATKSARKTTADDTTISRLRARIKSLERRLVDNAA